MDIVFDHIDGLGKITQMDFIYAPCAAYPLPSEELDAVESGWAPNEWASDGAWYQARQVRIGTYTMPKTARPAYLQFRAESGTSVMAEFDRYDAVAEAHRRSRGFAGHLDLRRAVECDIEKKLALTAWQGERLLAFTIMRLGCGFMSSIHCCRDYGDASLRLGRMMEDEECLRAAALGFRHLYIGPGYEPACLYKSKYDGFEWWTGREWSIDAALYKRLCDRDSAAKRIEEIAF